MMYMNMMEIYFTLNTAIRTADFESYKYILPAINDLCFTFNLQNYENYARFLVKYVDNLLNVDDTHPGSREEFSRGSFGVKRTNKTFSRQPIDLTLEQTINADAGNKLTGISYLTNSLAARQKWTKNHTLRSEMIAFDWQSCTGTCREIFAQYIQIRK